MTGSTEGSAFVDTNVLVYLYDDDEPEKQRIAGAVLGQEAAGSGVAISTQVLQELYWTVTRKLARPLPEDKAGVVLGQCAALPVITVTVPMILAAAEGSGLNQLAFWDALILEAAIAAGCHRVLSEDMRSGFVYRDRVRVVDPFAGGSSGGTT